MTQLNAKRIRLETLKMIRHRGFGHLGGALSIVETLSVLFGSVMRIRPHEPDWPERDIFVLSKGHGGPSYYATLALLGYFPMEVLNTLNDDGTSLPSHPDRLRTPGVDVTTGSLGQGISLATGIATAFKMDGADNRVFCIVGDGELNEGQVWEAMQFAAAHRLDNLVIFIDNNKKQLDGQCCDILEPFDLRAKAEAFGLHAQKVDGADEAAIEKAVREALADKGRAQCIVLDTIKGQGVKFLEELADNHHVRLNDAQMKQMDDAIAELEQEVGDEQ